MENSKMDFDREGRLRFMRVTDKDRQMLQAFWGAVQEALPSILDEFYNHLASEPATAKIVGNRSVGALKQAQTGHWSRLFSGTFDMAYLEGVYTVGMAHKRIGLEPRWYIGGYKLVLNRLIEVAVRKYKWSSSQLAATICAINTAVLLDMELVVSAYQDAIEREKAEQTRTIVDSIGAGLDALAKGEVTHRVTADLQGPFVKLKGDFNNALERIQETMKSVLVGTSGIRTGAGEISQAADDLSRRTEQQAASLEETAAALEEITATVKRTAENAKEAGTRVGQAKAAAQEGGQVVETAITAMSKIEQSSKQITDIIGVIDEIAFQTNLLALNAGVEAARAGDAGKGFAVVASEVRALAQRSSEAAKEIKSLIKASSEHVASGVKYVGDSGAVLKQIVDQVVGINTLVGEMAEAAQQQSTGIEEVNVAVSQMDQVTQQNAAMVEESTAASRNLASETEQLADLVGFFQVGVVEERKQAAPVAARSAAPTKPASKQAAASPRVPVLRKGGAAPALAPKAAAAEEEWHEF